MIENTTKRKTWFYWIRRGLYWTIPVIILYVIFQRIDIGEFKSNIAKTKPWLVALGLVFYVLVNLVGALRWHLLLGQYNRNKSKLSFAIKHYWIGSALGRFTPASLGWEAYRVAVSGRYFGHYAMNIAVIGAEKLMALLICMSMIILLYPMVPIDASIEIDKILRLAYILFFVALILFLSLNLFLRNRVLCMLLEKLELYFSTLVERVAKMLGLDEQAQRSRIPIKAMIKPLTAPKHVIPVLILTFAIQLVSAISIHIYFKALGYDLPFIANLFIAPILFFIFLLPLSFGSLGIREGTYILLYGLFQVPSETALLVSFFALLGMVLNTSIGGLLMLFCNVEVETLRKTNAKGYD